MSTTTQAMDVHTARARGAEGITVIGEAVRRVAPDQAEFLMEITATGSSATQALRDNQAKTAQVTQAVSGLGVQQADMQTISLNVFNVFSPIAQALPAYSQMPQLSPGMPDVQFGSCQAKAILRVNVREASRVGEVLDTAARAGALVSPFSFKAPDEAVARRNALEAAGKDARAKAEALAGSAGRKIGEAISITEEIIASNGMYTALRSAYPFTFGAGSPQVAGELEYYARVSASFRFQ